MNIRSKLSNKKESWFRYGSAKVTNLMLEYDSNPALMATRIIESVDIEPAPLRMVLGSQALLVLFQLLKPG